MGKLYDIMKAAKLGASAAPDYYTTLWQSLSKGSVKEYELTDTPPLIFESNGTNLIDWIIYGAENCGTKTPNLGNYNNFQEYMTLDSNTGLPVETGNKRIATITPIDVANNSIVKVVFTYSGQSTSVRFMYSTFANGTLIERVVSKQSGDVVDVSNADELYICIYTVSKDEISDYMVSEGSGSIPYEPYGFKIPVICGGQVTNIYIDSPLDTGESISKAGTGIDIPTVNGSNTLSVNTTVQPSQVYIKYYK